MIFSSKIHKNNLYNTLLKLSRNLFFYNKVKLADSFETRLYLMFIHFSVMLIIARKKNEKFDQGTYDLFFHNIENNLRELGFGDVSVNKKMKDFNKVLYDILLKLEDGNSNNRTFKINHNLIAKYFTELKDPKSNEFVDFESYFEVFFKFCFELSLQNMVRETIKFKY